MNNTPFRGGADPSEGVLALLITHPIPQPPRWRGPLNINLKGRVPEAQMILTWQIQTATMHAHNTFAVSQALLSRLSLNLGHLATDTQRHLPHRIHTCGHKCACTV